MKQTRQKLMAGLVLAALSFLTSFALLNPANPPQSPSAGTTHIQGTSSDVQGKPLIKRADATLNRPSSLTALVINLRSIHPLTLAALQILIVLMICVLLTDNEELELYLKIDFRPPSVDILQ